MAAYPLIDIYCHIYPEKFFGEMTKVSPQTENLGKRLRTITKLFDLGERFREMGSFGDYRQIISLPSPPIGRAPLPRLSGFEVLERLYLTQYFGVDPVALIDVEMKNGGVARQIEIRELAAEAGLRRERRAPAAGLVVIDRPPDIGGNGLGHIGSERHHEVHGNVAYLQRTRDFDRVVSSLRVADENERTGVAGGPVPQDVGDGRRPIQMAAHLRLDAPRPELVGEAIEAPGEHVEPAAQQEHPWLGRKRAGYDSADPPHRRSRTELDTGLRHAHRPKAEIGPSDHPPDRNRGVMMTSIIFHSLYLSFGSSA